MNIETIDRNFRTYLQEAGGQLRPSESELFSPMHGEGDTAGLPPLLRQPKILTGTHGAFLSVHPLSFADSLQMSDSDFLAFPRLSLAGNDYLMRAVDRGLAKITNVAVKEYGGTRRRLRHRPAEINAGSECTLPFFLLNAHNLLESQGPGHPTGLTPHEETAINAAVNIATFGLNHDRYIPCDPSDLHHAVIPISDALEAELSTMHVPYQVTQNGDTRILQVTDEPSVSRLYAPPNMEALVLPRRNRCPRMPIRLYPGSEEIAGWQISIEYEREHLEGNHRIHPIKIMTGATDSGGNWLSVDHVEFINPEGVPEDHRLGMVNALQSQGVIWNRDGWYTRGRGGGGEADSIPEDFPNDPDRAYCTLLRMCAEVLAEVYDGKYQFDDDAPSIEPLARAIRPSTDRLIDIVTNTGSIARYKEIEGLQQLIVAHLNQPHAWASLANALGLERIFPRAEPLWKALNQQPMRKSKHEKCTDGFISATVRMPCIDIDPRSHRYRLDEPTGIERFIQYAETVVGMKIPKNLSLLGKLAWLYQPLPPA